MTVDGTGWTFPSTGTWEITAVLSVFGFKQSNTYGRFGWNISNDGGSSFTTQDQMMLAGAQSSAIYQLITIPTIITITNASTQKIRFDLNFQSNNGGDDFYIAGMNYVGSSSQKTLSTYYMFKKLA